MNYRHRLLDLIEAAKARGEDIYTGDVLAPFVDIVDDIEDELWGLATNAGLIDADDGDECEVFGLVAEDIAGTLASLVAE